MPTFSNRRNADELRDADIRLSVSPTRLRDIADEHKKDESSRRRAEAHQGGSAATRRESAARAADRILESIPGALEEAAKHPLARGGGRFVVAQIPVATQVFTSIMQSRGEYPAEELRVLAAVKEKLPLTQVSGTKLELLRQEGQGGYESADGLDRTTGPVERYIIQATTKLPRRR